MSKEFLKKLGIAGVSLGLLASPLAFADFHEEEEPIPQEETAPDATGGNAEVGVGYDSVEYENEEEEFEYEEENEEEEWETPEDGEESTW